MDTIPLKDAVLCVECEVISVAKNHHCPVCGASGECVVRLEKFFERPATVETYDGWTFEPVPPR